MRGQKVSVKIKRHKVDSVKKLVEKGFTVENACKRMRIKKRTYYDYKKQKGESDLEDKRYKRLTEWQETILELLILMNPRGSIDEYVYGANIIDKISPVGNKTTATRYKVSRYLNSRGSRGFAGTRIEREEIAIKMYGAMIESIYTKDPYWQIWRQMLIPIDSLLIRGIDDENRKLYKRIWGKKAPEVIQEIINEVS